VNGRQFWLSDSAPLPPSLSHRQTDAGTASSISGRDVIVLISSLMPRNATTSSIANDVISAMSWPAAAAAAAAQVPETFMIAFVLYVWS